MRWQSPGWWCLLGRQARHSPQSLGEQNPRPRAQRSQGWWGQVCRGTQLPLLTLLEKGVGGSVQLCRTQHTICSWGWGGSRTLHGTKCRWLAHHMANLTGPLCAHSGGREEGVGSSHLSRDTDACILGPGYPATAPVESWKKQKPSRQSWTSAGKGSDLKDSDPFCKAGNEEWVWSWAA